MEEPANKSSKPAASATISEAAVYSAKAACAALLAIIAFEPFHLPGAIWAPISAVIVTQPKLHHSFRASMIRVAANLVGAIVGSVLWQFFGTGLATIGLGVFITGMICHFTKLEEGVRAAYAAVLIVSFTSEPHVWYFSLDRVLGVFVGCLAALAVGLIFDAGASMIEKARATGPKPHTMEE